MRHTQQLHGLSHRLYNTWVDLLLVEGQWPHCGLQAKGRGLRQIRRNHSTDNSLSPPALPYAFHFHTTLENKEKDNKKVFQTNATDDITADIVKGLQQGTPQQRLLPVQQVELRPGSSGPLCHLAVLLHKTSPTTFCVWKDTLCLTQWFCTPFQYKISFKWSVQLGPQVPRFWLMHWLSFLWWSLVSGLQA